MTTWNHRILAHEDGKGEVWFGMHEVYSTYGIPDSCTLNPITFNSDSLKSMKWSLRRMTEATKKPILWFGDKFPQEYKE